jgi:hypothetical protein
VKLGAARTAAVVVLKRETVAEPVAAFLARVSTKMKRPAYAARSCNDDAVALAIAEHPAGWVEEGFTTSTVQEYHWCVYSLAGDPRHVPSLAETTVSALVSTAMTVGATELLGDSLTAPEAADHCFAEP